MLPGSVTLVEAQAALCARVGEIRRTRGAEGSAPILPPYVQASGPHPDESDTRQALGRDYVSMRPRFNKSSVVAGSVVVDPDGTARFLRFEHPVRRKRDLGRMKQLIGVQLAPLTERIAGTL